jgi:hypothetical protein
MVCHQHGHLGFEKSRDWTALIPAVAAFTIGLGFSEIVGLSLAAGVFLVLLYSPEVRTGRDTFYFFVSRWYVWLAFFVPLVFYFGWRATHSAAYQLSPKPGIGDLWHYVGVAITQGFSASIFGFTYPAPNYQVVSGHYVFAAMQIVLLLFVVSMVRQRDAYKAWSVALASLVGLAVVHGEARASIFGAIFGTTYSDLLPALIVFVLCLALAFGTPTIAGNTATRPAPSVIPALRTWIRQARETRPWSKPVTVALGLGLVLGYLILVSDNTGYINEVSEGRTAKLQLATATKDWTTIESTAPNDYIWDTLLPLPLISPGPYPDDLASRVLPLFIPTVRVGSHPSRGLLVSASGRLVPAVYRPARTLLTPARAMVTSSHVTQDFRGRSVCATTTGRSGSIFLPAGGTLREPIPSGRWFFRLTVVSQRGWPSSVAGSTRTDGAVGPVSLHQGTQVVGLPEGSSPGPTIYLSPRSTVCLAHASIGLPVPTDHIPLPSQ